MFISYHQRRPASRPTLFAADFMILLIDFAALLNASID